MLASMANDQQKKLQSRLIATPLGSMLAAANESAICFLAFTDCKNFERDINRLQRTHSAKIMPKSLAVLIQLEQELQEYFAGSLRKFKTPLQFAGTPFQQKVWQALQRIPYGSTCSYAQLAQMIGQPTAFRAVALANSANLLSLIVPCHRVIKSDGSLCGYAGGVARKQWLLEHEESWCK